MTIPKNLGMILLAVYLIVAGLTGLLGSSLAQLSWVLPILALAAGILLLLNR